MFAEMSLGDLPEEIFSIQLYKSPKSFVSRRKESPGGGKWCCFFCGANKDFYAQCNLKVKIIDGT